jgi:hypothetical protein
MYCTVNDVRQFLPPPFTIGNRNIGTPNPGRPNEANRDTVTEEQVTYFIRYAQQEIDSRLNPFYGCPLRRIKTHEVEPRNNITAGTNVNVSVFDSTVFSKYDIVRMQNNTVNETTTVTAIPNFHTITLNSLNNNYDVDESLLSILKFPDPIPTIAARLTVSYAFDRLFNAEQAPDISKYGAAQRKLAMNAMDGILTGSILLVGQEHTGRRFLRGSLYDGFKGPVADYQFGREQVE